MAKLKLLSTIFSKLGSLTKNNGQIIVSRDSKSLYVDLDDERIEITDWIDINTEENLLAILTPLTNKYYYTKDSNKIWRYIGGEWICVNVNVNELTPTYAESTSLVKLSSGEKLSVAFGKISKAITDLISHIGDSVKHITSTERTNWNSAKTHADSAHAPADAQKNVQSDWSATSGDAYIKNKPTEFPPSIHTHTKSEISDFPSSLPASGGNSDTVNNHTVETDVPVDAVFTDTIYDDTEVKESIAELNSNLDTLEFGEVAGGSNLWDEKYEFVNSNLVSKNYIKVNPNTLYKITCSKLFNVHKYDSNYNFLGNPSYNSVSDGYTFQTDSNTSYIKFEIHSSYGSAYNHDIAVLEGASGTYEPYIPSVKMLADEVSAQKNELDTLEFGEHSGGKNLFEDEIKWIENITITRGTKSVSDGKITLTATSNDCYTDYDEALWKNNGIKTIPCKPNKKYTFSWKCEGDSKGDIYIFENGSTNNMTYATNKAHKASIITSADAEFLTIRVGVFNSGNSITYWNFQLEEGDTATEYKPFIPSVKMLADENTQQSIEMLDAKMLGWSVPRECTVQNYVDSDGIFHQKVGRVDLGSLDWIYETELNRFAALLPGKFKPSNQNEWTRGLYCVLYDANISPITGDKVNMTISGYPDDEHLYLFNFSYTDTTTFKTAMQGVYLYYELATEQTISVDGNEAVTKVKNDLYLNPSSISSVYSQASSSDCEYVIQQDGLYRLFLQTNIAIQDKTLEIALNGCAVSSHRTTNNVYEHTSILLYLQKGCVVNYNISQVGVECQAIAYILS